MTNTRIRTWWAIAALVVLGTALYGHTLDVPWYLDDLPAVINNPEVRDFPPFMRLFGSRGIGNFSFALNFHAGGAAPAGFHLVNIFLHTVTGFLVFLVLKRMVSPVLAFLGAALFLAHPVQTQAVTYVVQRFTSLAGLFFMLALYLFIRAIEVYQEGADKLSIRHLSLYLSAILAGAAAVLTKQNTAVLPIVLFFYCRYFRDRREPFFSTAAYVAPFMIAPLYAAFGQFLLPLSTGDTLQKLTGTDTFSNTRIVTPYSYFMTELVVIWWYLRLLFFPVGLRLEYDMPILNEITVPVLAAGGGLLLLLVAAVGYRRRFPLFSFGVMWFLVTLAIESTFIPLDPVFEHRLYLPAFGFILVILEGARRLPSRGAAIGLAAAIIACGILTWQRNDLWRHPVAFYRDNIDKAPRNPRPYLPVAKQYLLDGKPHEALALLEKGLAADPGSYLIYNMLGLVYEKQGDANAAISHFRTAVSLNPKFPEGHTNLGTVFAGQSRWQDAEAAHLAAIAIKEDYALAHYNLGVARYNLGKKREAFVSFRRAAALAPTDADALFNAAVAAFETGDVTYAENALPALQRLAPAKAAELRQEMTKK